MSIPANKRPGTDRAARIAPAVISSLSQREHLPPPNALR
jgi:hypothetical protein